MAERTANDVDHEAELLPPGAVRKLLDDDALHAAALGELERACVIQDAHSLHFHLAQSCAALRRTCHGPELARVPKVHSNFTHGDVLQHTAMLRTVPKVLNRCRTG